MKKWIKFEVSIVLFAVIIATFDSCNEIAAKNNTDTATNETIDTPNPRKALSKEFKEYWYAGNAEITSYKLDQARYGELREGTSVLVYVTEPFVAD